MKHKFQKNQNVMYRTGNNIHDAKIVRYIPESNSYLISFRQGNTIKERETVPERLYRRDDIQIKTAYHVSLLAERVARLEKAVFKR